MWVLACVYSVQMSYWLVLPSNHARLGNSLVKQMKRNLPYLIQSVPLTFQNDSAAQVNSLITRSLCQLAGSSSCGVCLRPQAGNTGWEGRASCEAFRAPPPPPPFRAKDCLEVRPSCQSCVLSRSEKFSLVLTRNYLCGAHCPLAHHSTPQPGPQRTLFS